MNDAPILARLGFPKINTYYFLPGGCSPLSPLLRFPGGRVPDAPAVVGGFFLRNLFGARVAFLGVSTTSVVYTGCVDHGFELSFTPTLSLTPDSIFKLD